MRGLTIAYLGVFVLAAIAPHNRGDWLLENLVVAAAIPALAWGHRRLVLSNFSYLLIFVFLVLHAVGAHYTYSLTPVGLWVRDALDLARNHYDRFVHLCFGLLLGYPVRELVRRRLHLHGFSGYAIPVVMLLATSALYEIVEYQAVRLVAPEVGVAFLGTQGDEWDSQKDMSLAGLGALLAMLGTALYRSRTGHEPWGILAYRDHHDA